MFRSHAPNLFDRRKSKRTGGEFYEKNSAGFIFVGGPPRHYPAGAECRSGTWDGYRNYR
jgi:hypothetical protein